ncbi:MAG: substrate-binding domain-containing protein [bacterium]
MELIRYRIEEYLCFPKSESNLKNRTKDPLSSSKEDAKAVEDIAFKRNYGVYLCNTDGSKERARYYLDSLIQNRVAGIISTLTWEIEEINLIENTLSQNIPIVGLAGARSNDKIDTVKPDDLEGSLTIPRMTTMSIPKNKMAYIAMDRLFKRINDDESKPEHIKIIPELIERETS